MAKGKYLCKQFYDVGHKPFSSGNGRWRRRPECAAISSHERILRWLQRESSSRDWIGCTTIHFADLGYVFFYAPSDWNWMAANEPQMAAHMNVFFFVLVWMLWKFVELTHYGIVSTQFRENHDLYFHEKLYLVSIHRECNFFFVLLVM